MVELMQHYWKTYLPCSNYVRHKKVLFMICDQTKLNKKELGVNLTAPAWTVLWSESAQKNIVSSPWRSPPSKAEAKLEDGISTLGLTTYGRRYMEATMVLYFNFSRWPYHSRCTTLISYFCLWSYRETGNGSDAIYINGKRRKGGI